VSREEILRLVAELGQGLAELAKTRDAVVSRKDADDETTTYALALLLMNYYTGAERMFRRIATYFGGIPQGERWHVELLHDMTLEIPEVRPRALTASTRDRLEALLRFRHVVRNLYAWTLRRDELQIHVSELAETHAALERDLAEFDRFLRELASG
jgi:hypothetical protein